MGKGRVVEMKQAYLFNSDIRLAKGSIILSIGKLEVITSVSVDGSAVETAKRERNKIQVREYKLHKQGELALLEPVPGVYYVSRSEEEYGELDRALKAQEQ